MDFKKIFCYITLITITFQVNSQTSQNKKYFDRAGISSIEGEAYYYRVKTEQQNEYKSYYINSGNLFFEGKILKPSETDESLNLYSETCTWYFKNKKTKITRTFTKEGLENGTSNYYYESGKIWKEIEFVNGNILNNMFKEYDEEGKLSKIFDENFINNSNDWDLYTSDKTAATIADGKFTLTSFTKEGAARYINLPSKSDDFTLDANINISKLSASGKAGIIYGFKDWQNYNFYLISHTSFYIGSIFEGVSVIKADGMFSSDIKKDEPNVIKILSIGEKNIYSINGTIQYSTDKPKNPGSNVGFSLSGKNAITVDQLIYKQINYNGGASLDGNNGDLNVVGTGSGIMLSTNGYILTNFHVVENSNAILVEINDQGTVKSYSAKVIQKDMDNDLAILKIEDNNFKPMSSIDYSFVESGTAELGASVFTIGFPYALSGMGKDAKFTDGKISSKTGYNGAINSYQTSIPIQPGNSGGPLFNDKGQMIGVMNATIKSADNVSYAIKINYIKNLMELLPDSPPFPSNKNLINATVEEKVKSITKYVVLIKIK